MKLGGCHLHLVSQILNVILRSPGVIKGQITKYCWIYMKLGRCRPHLMPKKCKVQSLSKQPLPGGSRGSRTAYFFLNARVNNSP